jgi:hypothetical protein
VNIDFSLQHLQTMSFELLQIDNFDSTSVMLLGYFNSFEYVAAEATT